MRVFTVGHSNRSIEEFLELLDAHGVESVVDVRTIPKSRHNPQFGQTELEPSLQHAGFGYERLDALGGLRKTNKDSTLNAQWRNDSFRGYADHMQTEEFAHGVTDLIDRARDNVVAIMCAEAVPWRCHRSLVGDALLVRGIEVLDIMSRTKAVPHTLTSFAHVEGTTITYPAQD